MLGVVGAARLRRATIKCARDRHGEEAGSARAELPLHGRVVGQHTEVVPADPNTS